MKKILIKEDSGFIGLRLDKFLTMELSDLSRSKVQALLKSGKILLNDTKGKASYTLAIGDEILVKDIEEKKFVLEAEEIDLPVLRETDDYFIIEKPAGMVVHPTEEGRHSTGTVAHGVLSKVSSTLDKLRPGIVHRLDKDTSGLLIVVKNKKARDYFVGEFKGRNVEKHYLALVNGILEHDEGIIDSPIARDLKNRKKMGVTAAREGKEAVSVYKVLEEFELNEKQSVSLLDVEIKTGRTHQIRVHMAAIGHPVVGDSVYGNRNINNKLKEKFFLKRQFLHAHTLEFSDFVGSKHVKVKSDLPKDLNNVLIKLREI